MKKRGAHIPYTQHIYLIECLISELHAWYLMRSLLLLPFQIFTGLDADQWTATPIKCIDAKMSIIIISYLFLSLWFDIYICIVFVQACTYTQMRLNLYTLVEWSHAAHKCNPSSVILLLSFVFFDQIIILWHASKRQKFNIKTTALYMKYGVGFSKFQFSSIRSRQWNSCK